MIDPSRNFQKCLLICYIPFDNHVGIPCLHLCMLSALEVQEARLEREWSWQLLVWERKTGYFLWLPIIIGYLALQVVSLWFVAYYKP